MNKSTAFTYDESAKAHNCEGHPECAERIEYVINLLKSKEYYDNLTQLKPYEIDKSLVELVHHSEYLTNLEELIHLGREWIDGDTYLNLESLSIALRGCGGLLKLAEEVADKKFNNGFALTRPPGHHATPYKSMGFCLISNIAVVASAMIKNKKAERIAIIDFDVHHGNGTEDCLTGKKNILFISTHQEGIFPNSGRPNNNSNIINLPIIEHTNDSEYIALLNEVIIPQIIKFKPDFMLVSAGYDAHINDPLANLSLSSQAFGLITEKIYTLCKELFIPGPVFTLEGGYNLSALAESVGYSFDVLVQGKSFNIKQQNIRPNFYKRVREFSDFYR